jgi:hypothetical protein
LSTIDITTSLSGRQNATCRSDSKLAAENEAGRRSESAAPASTVEALMYSLRAGGATLASAHTRRRLSELTEAQLHEVSARLQALRPHVARV